MLAGFYQTDDPAADIRALIVHRQLVTKLIAVCRRKFIGKPEAVAVLVIFFAVHDNKCRNGKIFADIERKGFIFLILDIKIDR